jgi:ethanolamine utilization protein EutP (predicted NTPase)
MPLADNIELRKYSLSIEEEGGIVFASSDDFKDIFIAVLSRSDLPFAIDTCLQQALSEAGKKVRVYVSCAIDGPTVEAVVEMLN